MNEAEASACPNCDAASYGRFCPSCGQEQALFPTVGEWLREALGELVAVDGKLLHTLRTLVSPPGELTAEWYRGRRNRYVSPFRLYLVAALLFFLAWPQTTWAGALRRFSEGFFVGSGSAAAQAAERASLGAGIVLEGLPGLLIILFIPLFAALLRLVTPGARPYVGHLVESLHLHVVAFVLMAANAPLGALGKGGLGTLLPLVLFGVFMVAAVGRVHDLKWWSSAARTLVLIAVYLPVVAVSIGLMLAIVFETSGGAL